METTLGEICESGGGEIQTGPFGSQLHKSDYQEEGTPVVMPSDIVEGSISTDDVARVGDNMVAKLSSHKLGKGDIVFGRRGDIGRCALVTDRSEGWLCGTGCLRVTPGNGEVDSGFLFYYLSRPSTAKWLENHAVGATMANLNTSILGSVPVQLPPLPVQRRIAGILSAYDDLIANNARRIELLEAMAQAVYREWFVHFRFPGHADAEMRETEALVPVPVGWDVAKLEDLCELTLGQSPKSKFYNEEGNGPPFHQGVADFGSRFPTHTRCCSKQKRVAQAGDILFSVRAPVGRMNVADQKMVIGRGLHAIRSKHDHQWFIFHQLKSKFYEEDMMGSGTIFKSVTKKDMLGLDLLSPPVSLLDHFEETVSPIEAQIENLTVRNRTLRRTRDLLLPRLVSGEVAVEAAVPVP